MSENFLGLLVIGACVVVLHLSAVWHGHRRALREIRRREAAWATREPYIYVCDKGDKCSK